MVLFKGHPGNNHLLCSALLLAEVHSAKELAFTSLACRYWQE